MSRGSLKKVFARVAGRVPLKTVLIVPFVLQTSITVGLVGYLSFKNGQQTVNNLAHELMIQASDRIDTLDLDFLTGVCRGLEVGIRGL